MKILPAKEYVYQHNNSPELLSDIPNLAHESYKDLGFNHPKGHNMHYEICNNTLKINTWVSAGEFRKLYNQDGCTIENNIKLYNYILSLFTNKKLEYDTMDKYIPTINFDYFKLANPKIYQGIDEVILKYDKIPKILICNGEVRANQCHNFNMDIIVQRLSEKFGKFIIFVTNNLINKSNVVYTKDIINKNGSDLIEISYLSTFCDIIIGRSSGPYCLSIIKENWLSKKQKKIICFNRREKDAFWHKPENTNTEFVWIKVP